ncbi:hypothetical protein [Rummeliibacillus sp. TYF005]|uniref:hypothetical protein n=1 Tax=Rummeliibacillus sp. TYF005 TaxID=2058214 RepID=UPI0013DD875C|nr:hypothetical protein [Rummeliibacillus sp. TYF005]
MKSKLTKQLKNKEIASSIDLRLFSRNELKMKPDKKGKFHVSKDDPNYNRWING